MKSKKVSKKVPPPSHSSTEHKQKLQLRSVWAFLFIFSLFIVLVVHFIYLQVVRSDHLQSEGDKRFEYNMVLPAKRGDLRDRTGETVLATSVPAVDVYAETHLVGQADEARLKELAKLLGYSYADLRTKLVVDRKLTRLLKRQVLSDVQSKIKALKINGVKFSQSSVRTYPQDNIFVHWLGFTDIDGKGRAGLELQYNKELQGESGLQRGLRNRMGQVIDVHGIEPARDGKNILLTVDSRLQRIAHQILKEAVTEHRATAGMAIIVDLHGAHAGEVLAMVSLPDYNANVIEQRKGTALRNRVIMDVFEPGSVMKPLVAALALDSGAVDSRDLFDTGSGVLMYQGKKITDVTRNKGLLDVAGILKYSSNVGMVLVSEKLAPKQMWNVFNAFGFGKKPALAFPGSGAGSLRSYTSWKPIEKATMSYGYGLSVSLLQLAQAYTALARGGEMVALRLRVNPNVLPKTIQIYSEKTANQVLAMLEVAASSVQKYIPDYHMAGKSGTARKLEGKAYSKTNYYASFVGMAPVSKPRLLVAVTIDTPKGDRYYGGQVAGPVVAKIMQSALGTLAVPRDRIEGSNEKP